MASSSSSSHQLLGLNAVLVMGESRAELRKVRVSDGHPPITSGSRSLGFAGGWSRLRAVSGYVSGVSEAADGLFRFVLSVCTVANVKICCVLIRIFRSHTGSLICRSQSSAQGGLQALFPFLAFTGSNSYLEKRKIFPKRCLGNVFTLKYKFPTDIFRCLLRWNK